MARQREIEMIKTIVPIGDWRSYPFWHTHDDRYLSVREMSTSHLINITRQIVNFACVESNIDPIPIKTPIAMLNLEKFAKRDWVMLCQIFYHEIRARLETETVSDGYLAIWRAIRIRVLKLSQKRLGMPATEIREHAARRIFGEVF